MNFGNEVRRVVHAMLYIFFAELLELFVNHPENKSFSLITFTILINHPIPRNDTSFWIFKNCFIDYFLLIICLLIILRSAPSLIRSADFF